MQSFYFLLRSYRLEIHKLIFYSLFSDKLNEPLNLSKSLVEYKLQQLSLVLNTNRALIGGLSSEDIMSRTPKQFSVKYKT